MTTYPCLKQGLLVGPSVPQLWARAMFVARQSAAGKGVDIGGVDWNDKCDWGLVLAAPVCFAYWSATNFDCSNA